MPLQYVHGKTIETLLRPHTRNRRYAAVKDFAVSLGQRSLNHGLDGRVTIADAKAVSVHQWRTTKIYLDMLQAWGVLKPVDNCANQFQLTGFLEANPSNAEQQSRRAMWREAKKWRSTVRVPRLSQKENEAESDTCTNIVPIALSTVSTVSNEKDEQATKDKQESLTDEALLEDCPWAKYEQPVSEPLQPHEPCESAWTPDPDPDIAESNADPDPWELTGDESFSFDESDSCEPTPSTIPGYSPMPGASASTTPVRKGKVKELGRLVNERSVVESLRRLGVDEHDAKSRDILFRACRGVDEGYLGHAVWTTLRQCEQRQIYNPVSYARSVLVRQLHAHRVGDGHAAGAL